MKPQAGVRLRAAETPSCFSEVQLPLPSHPPQLPTRAAPHLPHSAGPSRSSPRHPNPGIRCLAHTELRGERRGRRPGLRPSLNAHI